MADKPTHPDEHFIIELITSDFRGDHSADVRRAFVCYPAETVGDMLRRVGLRQPDEHVEIRMVRISR